MAYRSSIRSIPPVMDLYDFRDNDLLDMVRDSRKPGWWKAFGISDNDFIALETGAARACTFDASLVHGLLQTADHASAVFESGRQRRTEERVANVLEVRIIRQDRLSDEAAPSAWSRSSMSTCCIDQ